jgi:dihydropteroate synthase
MPTQLMGILNVGTDSSSERWFSHGSPILYGIQMHEKGADWIDIGGESTRPGASPVSEEEELKRVIPVILALKKEIPIPLSIDTMKAKVAAAAIEAGASLINDVSGFRDPEMRIVAAQSQLPICVMHMRETPATMQDNPCYPEGVIPFLIEWFKARIELLCMAGVEKKNIFLDPGIGFGKTVAQNVEILHNLPQLKKLGFPLLVGFSRKSFLGKIVHKTYPDLLPASLVAHTIALQANVDILRVHDVAENRDVIDLMTYLQKPLT